MQAAPPSPPWRDITKAPEGSRTPKHGGIRCAPKPREASGVRRIPVLFGVSEQSKTTAPDYGTLQDVSRPSSRHGRKRRRRLICGIIGGSDGNGRKSGGVIRA